MSLNGSLAIPMDSKTGALGQTPAEFVTHAEIVLLAYCVECVHAGSAIRTNKSHIAWRQRRFRLPELKIRVAWCVGLLGSVDFAYRNWHVVSGFYCLKWQRASCERRETRAQSKVSTY
jgi:hypothetical protein